SSRPAAEAISNSTLASIAFEASLSERHIATMIGSSLASVLFEIASAAGREDVFTTRVSSFESMCRLVEAGIGVGILAQSSARRYEGSIRVVFVPLDDPWADFTLEVAATRHVELPHLAQTLLAHLSHGEAPLDAPMETLNPAWPNTAS
ncbi:MAG: hypothetical protein EON92_10380, partial [Burkholderiales bacterium]